MRPDDEEGAAQPHAQARLEERVARLEAEMARRASVPGSGVEEREPLKPETPVRGWRRGVVVTAKLLFAVILLNGLCAQGIDAVREYRKGRLDNGILMTIGFLVSLAICSIVAMALVVPWLQARRGRGR